MKKIFYYIAVGILYAVKFAIILLIAFLTFGLIHFLVFQVSLTTQIILGIIAGIVWAWFYVDMYQIDEQSKIMKK